MAQSNPRKTLNKLLHKQARVWVTTTVVLAAVAVFVLFQAVSGLSPASDVANQGLYNTSEAASLKDRLVGRSVLGIIGDIMRNIGTVLSPNSAQIPATTTSTGAGNTITGGGRSVSPAGTSTTGSVSSSNDPNLNGTAPVVDANTCVDNNRVGQKFSDDQVFTGQSGIQDAINARDEAWRNSNAGNGFNYPRRGPGAPALPIYSSFSTVDGLFAIQNERFNMSMGSVPGLDAFTVINPQGGIYQKYNQLDYVIDYGAGTAFSAPGPSGETNISPGFAYSTPGHYTLRARSWYLCFQLLPAGSTDIHGRTGVYAQATTDIAHPKHIEPASPISTAMVTVADAKYKGWTLAAPDLLIKNQASVLPPPGNTINHGKDKIYKPSDQGGPELMDVIGVDLVNIGDTPITINKISFSDSSVFARMGDKRVVVKHNGAEIGTLDWPILSTPNLDKRAGAITLSSPLVIAPGATDSLMLSMQIVTVDLKYAKSDIQHQVCFGGFGSNKLPLPSELKFNAGGRDSHSSDGGKNFTFTFAAGCGEPFIIRNDPDVPVSYSGIDAY